MDHRIGCLLWTTFFITAQNVEGYGYGRAGLQEIPQFVIEPPSSLTFLNTSGATLNCAIRYSQVPAEMTWVVGESGLTPVVGVPGIRESLSNGSLIFYPFSPSSYRQDIHSAAYRCLVTSPAGSMVSRTSFVKAVVHEDYEVRVYDEYVISGNTAVLKCHIAPYVQEYVKVVAWTQDGSLVINPGMEGGVKHMILHDGSLHIYRADPSDGYRSYRCQTNHTLTGEIRKSSPGRVIITEPQEDSPPRLTVSKKIQITVKAGQSAILPCAAQAHPTPSYIWTRAGDESISEVVGTSPRFSQVGGLLLISTIGVGDQGRYLCNINNSVGRDFIEVAVRVTEPLNVHVSPNRLLVDMGNLATFRCVVQGHPVTSLKWLKNGLPLPMDSRINNTPRETLIISRVGKSDRGIYQCVISARHHTIQAAAFLALGDSLPEFHYRFRQQTLQPGLPVSLKCVASGNPPPQFTWTLDGFPLPESDRYLVGQYVTVHDDVISHVNITNIRVEDGGVYRCMSSNSVGEVSHQAPIRVYGPPFIRPMNRVSAVAGSDLKIQCPVAGYPIQSISWEKDGRSLPMTADQRVYSNGTLIIKKTQRKKDKGRYTCKAVNSHGHSASRDVTITVTIPPKIMPFVFTNRVLSEGNRASITCQILEGDLPLNFRWEKDGGEIPIHDGVSTRLLDDYSSQLIIERISSRHNGQYSCLATNEAATRKHTATLTVNVPPHWLSEPENASVSQGSDVTLNCQADGYPKPTISWKKSLGTDLETSYRVIALSNNVIISPNGSLTFRNIEKSREGKYLCEAKNGIKSGLSKVVTLIVNSPAYFPEKVTRIVTRIGEKAELKCSVLGDLPIDILWYANSRRLDPNSDHRIKITREPIKEGMLSTIVMSSAIRTHSGTYTCNAANAFGRDSKIIELVVQEEPEAPRNLRVAETQSRSISLSWSAPYSGNTPIQNYIIQYKLASESWPARPQQLSVPGDQIAAVIEDLNPASAYHLRVTAQNALGLGNLSEIIQATTEEEEPSGPPLDVRVTPESSTTLRVTWKPPARDQWNGNILGYYLGHRPYAASSEYNFQTIEVGSQYGGSATLAGLQKYTRYQIVVQAFNNRGAGPSSDPEIETTLEDAPSSPPETIRCESTSPQSISVAWRPPPQQGQNGLIKGYRLLYQKESDYPDGDPQTDTTAAESTNLYNLDKFSNYSISVLAFTAAGDGVVSDPVFCRTLQDVPDRPADIKAVINSPSSILVTWLPPIKSNGELLKYTLYIEITSHGKKKKLPPRNLQPDETTYLVKGLSTKDLCTFWVTGTTPPGEGIASKKVSIRTKDKVGAQIASFGVRLEVPWKENIRLHCHAVGVPQPQIQWSQNDVEVTSGDRIQILPNGSLFIRDVQKDDAGNLTCTVNNTYNTDTITYQLTVQVPPAPPSLFVQGTSRNSLTLRWTIQPHHTPVRGFIINYKRDSGDWEEVQLHTPRTTHTLTSLVCGSRYQLYVTAYNKVGTGLPSEIHTTSTKGTEPIPPSQSLLLDVNSTSVMVHLGTFEDGGCPILYYSIEFKKFAARDWISVSDNVAAVEKTWIIRDLLPSTRYTVKVTAYNRAGSRSAVYHVKTRTPPGVFKGGANGRPIPTESTVALHEDPKVLLPSIAVVILLICLIVTAIIWIVKRRKNRKGHLSDLVEPTTAVQIGSERNFKKAKKYTALAPNTPSTQDTSLYKNDSDFHEEICPYATFQLPAASKNQYGEATETGIVYSGAYHPVQGAFVYHEPKRSGGENFPMRRKEPEYMKVRRKGRRDAHMESTESDNLGSTDSEVKKILSLHMPISEYETLGSDSEGAGQADSPPTFAESAALSHAIVHHPAHKGHTSHGVHVLKKNPNEPPHGRSSAENKIRMRSRQAESSKSHDECSSSTDSSSSERISHHRRGKKIPKRSNRAGSRTPYEETSFSYPQNPDKRREEISLKKDSEAAHMGRNVASKSSHGGKSSGMPGRRATPVSEPLLLEDRNNGAPPPLPPRGVFEVEDNVERGMSAGASKAKKFYKKGARPRDPNFQINV